MFQVRYAIACNELKKQKSKSADDLLFCNLFYEIVPKQIKNKVVWLEGKQRRGYYILCVFFNYFSIYCISSLSIE
ncbi:MAG: hypothetical protein EAZ08_07610 [Cytophagales bacterium]|nr:MAG: hypothetical protein EAZ08_07610 [Cytophagales bacterium]